MNLETRPLDPGIGIAVAKRTYQRNDEVWSDVSKRVALGNSLLHETGEKDRIALQRAIANGSFITSGRHLQHGDITQPSRNLEVFTNCLHGETKVLTQEYGPAKIEDLVNKTATIKCVDGEWRKATCTSHGHQKLFKYSFKKRTGPAPKHHTNYVIATRNHRWHLIDGSVDDCLCVGQMLKEARSSNIKLDAEAICHGIIFGDGTAHKRRNDYAGHGLVSQGRSYCGIRLCGEDKKYLKYFEGVIDFNVNYPSHAKGDPVVYVGKKPWKEFPHTCDPEYIAGFIYGWWLADGSKTYHNSDTNDTIEISTANPDCLEWLKDYAAYAGYAISGYTTHERKSGDGSFANGKTLYSIRMFRTEHNPFSCFAIEEYGVEEVFCFEEPVTSGFVLANGILTGNCSTACTSFMNFLLLLNGSGVGRSYDDDSVAVDWVNMPNIYCVLSINHKDYKSEYIADNGDKVNIIAREDFDKYPNPDLYHMVEDSREGWAKALEIIEVAAWNNKAYDHYVLDFSNIRESGQPIKGMQNRPASGPLPVIYAFMKIAQVKYMDLAPWKATMFIDHYAAECVANGGARRSARIAVKFWKDKDIGQFINIKSDYPWMWSSNNSIGTDAEFWEHIKNDPNSHAAIIYNLVMKNAFENESGEPGFINLDKLTIKE